MRWLLLIAALVACSDERPRQDGGATDISVHGAGILDPNSDDFHVKVLQRENYDFTVCQKCHGDDFAGGKAQKTCLGCHTQGPTACVTCHQAGPTTNAHPLHLQIAKLTCNDCHLAPAQWDGGEHIKAAGAVEFGTRANLTIDPADRGGPPTYADGTCTNIYCHGNALHAAGGVLTQATWSTTAPSGGCNRCHGAPPPNHAQDHCATCHPANAPHIDGIVQVGSACNSCHGSATSNAPPRDLSGNTVTTAMGVGAHQAHLLGWSSLRGPIACETCHLVPQNVNDPGHIDTAPPAEVNVALGWDRSTGTCANAWCHGPARPVWNTTGSVVCGSCHGVPPNDSAHTPSMTLTTCSTCHPKTIDPTGMIIVTGGTSTHIDGVVDVP